MNKHCGVKLYGYARARFTTTNKVYPLFILGRELEYINAAPITDIVWRERHIIESLLLLFFVALYILSRAAGLIKGIVASVEAC